MFNHYSLVVQRREPLKPELNFLSKVRADVIRIWGQSRALVHQISQLTKSSRTLAIKNMSYSSQFMSINFSERTHKTLKMVK